MRYRETVVGSAALEPTYIQDVDEFGASPSKEVPLQPAGDVFAVIPAKAVIHVAFEPKIKMDYGSAEGWPVLSTVEGPE